MSPADVLDLIRLVFGIGKTVAEAIAAAIHAGDVSAVEQLSKVLPDAVTLAQLDEAARLAARARAAKALAPSGPGDAPASDRGPSEAP